MATVKSHIDVWCDTKRFTIQLYAGGEPFAEVCLFDLMTTDFDFFKVPEDSFIKDIRDYESIMKNIKKLKKILKGMKPLEENS